MNEQGNRPRDSQRKRVYDSEDALMKAGHKGSRFTTVADVQTYVDTVTATDWWREHYPRRLHIEVKDGRGSNAARSFGDRNVIAVPKHGRCELVVLHELVHQGRDVLLGIPVEAWHGPEFTRSLLDIVAQFMGVTAAARLRARFRTHRVRVSPGMVYEYRRGIGPPVE